MTAIRTDDVTSGFGLSVALREQTQLAHEQAENAPFVTNLMDGVLPLAAYADLVIQNHAIYTALEQATERWRGTPVAGPFVLDELIRVPSLRADLEHLLGADCDERATARLTEATRRYVERLHTAASSSPAAFIAHHYVRYLGDLSGGQVVRSAVVRHYGEDGLHATAFYTFLGIPKIKPFRDAYRTLLDDAALSDDERHQTVAEAVVAFGLNQAVFHDLGKRHPAPTAQLRSGGDDTV